MGPLVAQEPTINVSGTVIDAESGETLIGATIYSAASASGTSTNEYGFYSLTAPEGKYTLSISYIGYAPIEKEIQLKTLGTIKIENIKINRKLFIISNSKCYKSKAFEFFYSELNCLKSKIHS